MTSHTIKKTEDLPDLILKSGKKILVFDIFDTIIHRHNHPQDIKKIAASKLKELYPDISFSSDELYALRVELEKNICKDNHEVKGFDMEFNFSDFARLLYDASLNTGQKEYIPADVFIKNMIEIEIRTELANQYLDQNILNAIKHFKQKEYTILVCSDFYLDANSINEILKEHGILPYISKTIVSSEYLLTKRSGRLYERLKDHIDLPSALMIGDNYESDFTRAQEHGMSAIFIDRGEIHQLYQKKAKSFGIDKIAAHEIKEAITAIPGIFPEFSFTAFYFIRTLYFKLRSEGFKHAFFLSREGQLLEKLFNIFQDNCIFSEADKIKTHYLKASRRSTFLPGLKSLDVENFHTLFRQYVRISLAEFMQSLGFEPDDINVLAQEIGVDPNHREEDFPHSDTFLYLLTSDRFIELYEIRRKEQKSFFTRYFNQFTEGTAQSKNAIIDVGWKGTIQDNIVNIFADDDRTILGYYMGLIIPAQNTIKSIKEGLVFSVDDRNDILYSTFDENRSLFEVLFAADHGSIKYYIEDSNGKVDAIMEDFSEEESFFTNNIAGHMKAMEERFLKICQLYNHQIWEDGKLKIQAALAHARMVYKPTGDEVAWFLNLYHVENFGVFERNVFNRLGDNMSFTDRFLNYLEYKRFPQKFTQNVSWPYAELVKHGLKKEAARYGSKKMRKLIKSV